MKSNIPCPEELDIWQKVVEDLPLSVQTYTPEGLCLTCNKAWEKLWGSKKINAVGKYNILKDPQVIARHLLSKMSEAFKGKQIFFPAVPYISPEKIKALVGKPLAEFLRRKRLNRTYVDVWLYPIKDKGGKIVRVVVVHQDATKKIQQKFKIIEQTERSKSEIKRLKELAEFNEFEIDKLKRIKGLK